MYKAVYLSPLLLEKEDTHLFMGSSTPKPPPGAQYGLDKREKRGQGETIEVAWLSSR